jgi:hypothetical protein
MFKSTAARVSSAKLTKPYNFGKLYFVIAAVAEKSHM